MFVYMASFSHGMNCKMKAQSPATNFREAKKILKEIYNDRMIDFYCGCKYSYEQFQGFQRTVLDPQCGIQARRDSERAFRIEWEHVVPASAFGATRPCWRNSVCEKNGRALKGRQCCVWMDPEFSIMEADLHNLQPVPGEMNADRNNFYFGIVPGEARNYGNCDFEVDFQNRLAEPREEIRGDIARTYLYMEDRYQVRIGGSRKKLYEIWDRKDPPDGWEKERNRRILKVQGNSNPFIDRWEKGSSSQE